MQALKLDPEIKANTYNTKSFFTTLRIANREKKMVEEFHVVILLLKVSLSSRIRTLHVLKSNGLILQKKNFA